MLLPVALNLKDAPCLVVGGGEVAARKVRSLVECEAKVHVVSPQLCDDLETLRGHFEYSQRIFQSDDCNEMRLVFACTDSREVNAKIVDEARLRGVWCNIADDASASDFQSMATVRRGEITVAVSTSGGSPALSKYLKQEIESCIGDEYAQLLQLMSEERSKQNRKKTTQKERATIWHRILDSDVLDLLRRGEAASAQSRVREIMSLQ